MSKLPISILLLTLIGCEDSSNTAKKDERMKECLVSQAVSAVVDPKNIMLYAATADLMTRAIVLNKATVVRDCRTIIIGARKDIDLLATLAEGYCPKELMELSDEQLIKLDEKAMEIIRVASNLKGSITDKAIGDCVEL